MRAIAADLRVLGFIFYPWMKFKDATFIPLAYFIRLDFSCLLGAASADDFHVGKTWMNGGVTLGSFKIEQAEAFFISL
jgi:hypothetical protein